MADRERRRLLAAAGLLVAAATVLSALLGQGHASDPTPDRERGGAVWDGPLSQGARRDDRKRGPRKQPAPTPGERAASEDRARRPAVWLARQREREGASSTARAFLFALLRRENPDGGGRAWRAITRLATADWARLVLGDEPRVAAAGARYASARLVGIEPVGLGRRRAELAATIERGARRSGLLVTLVRREGRWRVAGLR